MSAREFVPDHLRAARAPLLPEEPAKPRCSDRDVLRGVVFLPRSGIPEEMLS